MCGILAIYCKNRVEDLKPVKNAQEILSNRGPDSDHFSTSPHILGFRRLAIVEPDEKAMQPFQKEGITVLCNGEIYNHKKLEYTYNLKCESGSDCECILHLYRNFGFETMIKYLSGDFAIAIIDGDDMYFGRDRIGVRPLFYGRTVDGNLAVASYARALTDYCPNVKQVPPGWGHYNKETDGINFYEYSYPEYNVGGVSISKLVHSNLIKAVEARLMSDRPIGCLLSGGLDSSLIASILCRLIGGKNVRTYSIGMNGSLDLYHARKVSEYLGTNHTEIIFTPKEGFEAIPDVIRDLESYDITTIRASVGMWLLSKWIAKHTEDTVLLSGEGADELFCGYLYFHYAPSPEALGIESKRLVKNLYLYDVLRADRCVSSHGLELRVPFLDKSLVDLCLAIKPELRMPQNGMEKHLLRTAFKESGFLPDSVLWRRKDGMSDGISGSGKRWYEHIQDFVEPLITDDEWKKSGLPSKEATYYRKIYDEMFPTYQPKYEYWMPQWVKHDGDPSGRILEVFEED